MKFLKKHILILLYTYFWLGIFIGGLCAPINRVELLNSPYIKEGWHISLYSLVLFLPIWIIYLIKMRK